MRPKPPHRLFQAVSNSVLVARLINDHLFQVDDFWLDEECMDFGTDHTLQIQPMGYKVSFDEFDELLSDVDNLTRAGSFILFLGILWGNVDKAEQEDIWRQCSAIYQWDIPELPEVPGNHYIDISRLRKNLKKNGLEALSLMLEAVDGSTGNVFYDFDHETWMPLTISEKDLLALHEDWQKVVSLKKVLDQADDLLNNKPDVFRVFLGAYLKSLRRRDQNPGMGQQGLYYYFHTVAKALTAYGDDTITTADGKSHDWRYELMKKFVSLQKTDLEKGVGYWQNENNRWWENDPVLCTAYTLLAIEILQKRQYP